MHKKSLRIFFLHLQQIIILIAIQVFLRHYRRIDPRVIKDRVNRLNTISAESARARMTRAIGTTATVLIEDRASTNRNLWHGYTGAYIKVSITSRRNLQNQLIPVVLTALTPQGMQAKPSRP